MHDIERKAWKIVNRVQEQGEFLNVEEFLPLAKTLVFVTCKGTGKTYSTMKVCANAMKEGKQFGWIRNTKEEFKDSHVVDSWNNLLDENGFDKEEWVVRPSGIYRTQKGRTISETGKVMGALLTMNKSYNSASANAFKVDYMVYDEFINKEFTKKSLGLDFINLCNTFGRTNESWVILLGNSHTDTNDILVQFGVDGLIDWNSGETQIIYNDYKDLLVVYLSKYEVKQMKKANDRWERLMSDSEEYQRFHHGIVSQYNGWGIRGFEIYEIDKYWKPLFQYDLGESYYTVGLINDQADESVKNCLYIKESIADHFDVPRFSFRPQDKRSWNTYLLDLDDLEPVQIMLNYFDCGKLFFSSVHGKQEFIDNLLKMLKQFMQEERK